ncbi:MAG: hypothetical protein EOP14_05390 [Pseudomonas sp.]|nr:MAG: hypothetical protein EOP14_05390 [Pseudomonas sp.]
MDRIPFAGSCQAHVWGGAVRQDAQVASVSTDLIYTGSGIFKAYALKPPAASTRSAAPDAGAMHVGNAS